MIQLYSVPNDKGIVVRQHQENHGQRQIVVMSAALFGDLSVFRIRGPAPP